MWRSAVRCRKRLVSEKIRYYSCGRNVLNLYTVRIRYRIRKLLKEEEKYLKFKYKYYIINEIEQMFWAREGCHE